MGRVLLVGRLAAHNVRRRPVEAALLVLAIMAATTTLTLGRVLDGVTDHPYERTREATAGPDVVASVGPEPVSPSRVLPTDLAALEALADAGGVVDHSGPYPATPVELEVGGVTADAWAEGRDPAAASVDQPQLTEGRWVDDGGVVVEAAFADTLGVSAGDEVILNGRSFPVVGVAVTAAASYTDVCFGEPCSFMVGPEGEDPFGGRRGRLTEPPRDQTVTVDTDPLFIDDAGLVWLTKTDALGLAPNEATLSYVLNLKLADPADATAFVDAHPRATEGSPVLASWLDLRYTYNEFVRGAQLVFTAGASLLTLLAIASVAVLVGGRMADQKRRVGLLKAAGGTPGLVAVVLLAEYVGLALLSAAAGLALGWLAAPVVSGPGAGLVGSAGAPSLTMSTVGVVTAVALVIAVVASFASALRAARTSTVHALADAARRPRRTRWLIALSTRLPVPVLLGVRVIARRPRRVLLGVASILVTVSGIVAVLAAHATIAADWRGASSLDPIADRANQVLLVLTVMLAGLAAINAVVITWSAALENRQSLALARALGATPRQVSAGLSAAQVVPALVGATLGVPGGLALFNTTGDELEFPTSWQLVAVVVGTALVVAGLTTIPARLGARRPAAEILQAEHA
ncbi:MAG: FtsX-like permease family protein [Acidimicrobiales bacterium]